MSTPPEQQHFFVRRPIVAMVIAIITVIVGVVSMLGLPIEQYPDITPPIVQVRANYTGANAISVERSVATPLEQQINGVENMLYMKSTNANDGSMVIDVTFEVGTDPDMNTVFTQTRVSAATAKLPEEVKRLGVTTQKSLPNIMQAITLTSPDGRYDQQFLGNYALINIKDELARLPGVGRVDVMGASDYSMRIWVKPDLLAKMRIGVEEIVDAIRQQSVIVPGGKFGAEPAPPGTELTYTVRMPDRLQTEDAFGAIVVRTRPDGSQVRVRDIARVELGVENYLMFTRMNGAACALIAVYQAPGSNAVDLAARVEETMAGLARKYPEGMEHAVALDSTKPITAGIEEIVVTLGEALLLVILVVFLFIQDWRATLIPTLAIPVSLVGAFMLFPMLGFSINVLSLLGLVLAIGIVVDDAIVVVEAVQVNMEKGMNAAQATTAAMKEVTAPVIATTLVMVAVFVPVATMAGITGRLYQQFAVTIVVSVLISSVNALSLSPALCSVLLRKPTPMGGPLGRFFGRFNRAFDRTTGRYMGFTQVVARKLTRSLLFVGVLVVGLVMLGGAIPGGFLPEEDQGYFYVNIQLPEAASLQRTDEVCAQVERILSEVPGIDMVTTASGFSLLSGAMSTNAGFMFVTAADWGDRQWTVAQVMRKINYRLATEVSAGQAFCFGPPAIPGLGSGSGFSIMLQDQGGNEPTYLAEHAGRFMQAAMQRPEIASTFTPYNAGVPQRYLDIDKEKAMKLGVPLNSIYSTVGSFLGGTYVNDFDRFGRLYKAYVQAEPEYRLSADKLDLFYVKNTNGDPVPLSTLVHVEETTGPEFTNRFNLYRSVELTGAPAPGYSSGQALDALEEVAQEVLPDDMGYSWNAMSYQEKAAGGSAGVVFGFSLLFVFLILAAQYESWSLPFSILLGTPFAVFGAFLLMWVFRFFSETYVLNIFAQISLVMLIAMAAKNAILIVEFAKISFDEGMSLYDAAMKAAKDRFRPILMTVFSFILGVLPLVIASGAGSLARNVMGVALLGGIGIATLIGVFMYPMFFVLVGKLAKYEEKRDAATA
ncbi:MAG TPA: efflux RND transporter permease subunit [Flavobacteriales bacterium]|nr:efflux RND transporter permease subunit [Flavobacteriales bacterium]